jgi:hypothetical protein
MQDQQNIQNVKMWQAPQLIDLGEISSGTENTTGVGGDGASNFAS